MSSGPRHTSTSGCRTVVTARIALTLGDPRGVGPELAPLAARSFLATHGDTDIVLLGHDGIDDGGLAFIPVGSFDGSESSAGTLSAQAVEKAVELALSGEVSAIVTGPVSKPALRAAGWDVPGQTEMLQALTRSDGVGMLMAAERTRFGSPLRVLLATTHLPLASVAETVTFELLRDQIRILDRALRQGWKLAAPRIALCALNPHASDGGLFGDHEARIMEPAVRESREEGVDVSGPLPADTVFRRALDGEFDAVVAPYHDVGMAAFKTVSFGEGVNVTLGLPIVRTSPDHGTAFDIAGRGLADPASTIAALCLAHRLATGRAQD